MERYFSSYHLVSDNTPWYDSSNSSNSESKVSHDGTGNDPYGEVGISDLVWKSLNEWVRKMWKKKWTNAARQRVRDRDSRVYWTGNSYRERRVFTFCALLRQHAVLCTQKTKALLPQFGKCSVRCRFVYDEWSDPMEVAGSERWQQIADDVTQKVTKSGGAELYAAVGS